MGQLGEFMDNCRSMYRRCLLFSHRKGCELQRTQSSLAAIFVLERLKHKICFEVWSHMHMQPSNAITTISHLFLLELSSF